MATGTRFRIRFWSWVCPDEMRDEHHWCTGICPVMEITEVIEA